MEKQSAILRYENAPGPLPIYSNHIDMVRIRTDAIADAILSMVLDAVRSITSRVVKINVSGQGEPDVDVGSSTNIQALRTKDAVSQYPGSIGSHPASPLQDIPLSPQMRSPEVRSPDVASSSVVDSPSNSHPLPSRACRSIDHTPSTPGDEGHVLPKSDSLEALVPDFAADINTSRAYKSRLVFSGATGNPNSNRSGASGTSSASRCF